MQEENDDDNDFAGGTGENGSPRRAGSGGLRLSRRDESATATPTLVACRLTDVVVRRSRTSPHISSLRWGRAFAAVRDRTARETLTGVAAKRVSW